jgi:hypothetical protein
MTHICVIYKKDKWIWILSVKIIWLFLI